jgi:hypothetical protein
MLLYACAPDADDSVDIALAQNFAPNISISAPVAGSAYGTVVDVRASVSDGNGVADIATVEVWSDIDGLIEDIPVLGDSVHTTIALTVGAHALELVVVDMDGETGDDTVMIVVE